MSELRLDLATGEWVILATERARRPRSEDNDCPIFSGPRVLPAFLRSLTPEAALE